MPARRRHHVEVRRIYEHDAASKAGRAVLVDRLWPRGVAKADADFDEWVKEVAPSTELRRWYGHEVDRFDEFARRYRAELKQSPASAALEELVAAAKRGPLTLLTATRDVDHSAAHVLQQVLQDRLS
jgi:uncharacterized protein YeaO (DUF488 family)